MTAGQNTVDAAAWVREHYATGTDALSVEGFVRDLADDVRMVSPAGELSGLAAVRASARALFSVLSALRHEIHTVATPSPSTIVVDATVTYWFLSGHQTSLPAVTTFQMRDGQVAIIHLDMDMTALRPAT
ncbi:nuclear transport factor 2 family protein [Mycobacterium sp. URHB0044]|uniref:nuclear transport factor 2 family protein n=1 Tax=Mycobacterium sp. URHB0044 TaxID=1380386 RepID=UPI00048C1D5D|nr:nuclear transport factor 2 family protein [Mycobacterium sp. URHB0044]